MGIGWSKPNKNIQISTNPTQPWIGIDQSPRESWEFPAVLKILGGEWVPLHEMNSHRVRWWTFFFFISLSFNYIYRYIESKWWIQQKNAWFCMLLLTSVKCNLYPIHPFPPPPAECTWPKVWKAKSAPSARGLPTAPHTSVKTTWIFSHFFCVFHPGIEKTTMKKQYGWIYI